MIGSWYQRTAMIVVLIAFAHLLPAASLTKNEAVAVAQPVLERVVLEGRSGWTAQSRLVCAYPVYMEGIEGVSYYEIKVKTGNEDSGYILVNINRTDIEVPEISTQGLTLSELYQKKTGQKNLRLVRYDWFRSSVKAQDPVSHRDTPIASIGFGNSPDIQLLVGGHNSGLAARIQAFDAEFRQQAQQKGCAPFLLKEAIDSYYAGLGSGEVKSRAIDGGPRSPCDTTSYRYLKRVLRADGGVPVAGDFSRDDPSIPNDVAIYNPSDATWDYDHDLDGDTDEESGAWSTVTDIQMGGDFDRDGYVDDVCVLRASTKEYIFDMGHNGTTDSRVALRGSYDQMRPVAGDFDSDGDMDDIAMFSQTTHKWYFDMDHNGTFVNGSIWGITGDIPVSGDFDSDGFVDDVGVFRPSTRIWYFDYSHNGTTNAKSGPWAVEGDKPFGIDADGDGFADDVGVYRSSSGMWYYDHNHNGTTDNTIGAWGATGVWWHLPSWNQPEDADGYPAGCANTAWAMVYAYWQAFKGQTNLFPGLSMFKSSRVADCQFGSLISDVMWEIGRLTETEYGEDDDGKYGSTTSWNMPQGIDYAKDQGYGDASCTRWRGGERGKWDAIDAEIAADRPVMILICHDGTGSSDHFVCIEATVYVSRTGSDAIGYLVNFGWGEYGSIKQKWIYSRPTWYDPHHSIYDAYLVRF